MPTVSTDDLVRDSERYTGKVLALQPAAGPQVLAFGFLALEPGARYVYGGCADERTLVFVNKTTNVPVQIFCAELQGAEFTVL